MSSSYATIYTTFSLISGIFSAFVVISSLLAAKGINSKRVFSHILFMISICDLAGSVANSFGFPSVTSQVCHAQAFMYLYFFPASWLWTGALVFQLRTVMIFSKVSLDMKYLHIFIWPFSLFLALIPLSTNPYGQDDLAFGLYPCQLGGSNSKLGNIWAITNLGGLAILIFAVMCLWMVEVSVHYQREEVPMPLAVRLLYNAIRWYPIGMFVTWFPLTVIFMFNVNSVFPPRSVVEPLSVLSTQYGTVLACIYFYGNPSMRHRWARLFLCNCWGESSEPNLEGVAGGASKHHTYGSKASSGLSAADVLESSNQNEDFGSNTGNHGQDGQLAEWMYEYPTTSPIATDQTPTAAVQQSVEGSAIRPGSQPLEAAAAAAPAKPYVGTRVRTALFGWTSSTKESTAPASRGLAPFMNLRESLLSERSSVASINDNM